MHAGGVMGGGLLQLSCRTLKRRLAGAAAASAPEAEAGLRAALRVSGHARILTLMAQARCWASAWRRSRFADRRSHYIWARAA